MLNGTDQSQAPPENTDQAKPPPENTPQPVDSKSRKRATPGDDNWLPPDWRTETIVRTSGTKAGVVDKFYYEPITDRKFRSKSEVLYYLEHGTTKKAVKRVENMDQAQPPPINMAQAQPPPINTAQAQAPLENMAQLVDSKSRKRASPGDDSWLPSDWRAEIRVRTSGSKNGVVDKYYYEPVTGRKFRSKNEVLHYLEHGTTPKKGVKKAENGDLQSEHSEGRGSIRRQTRSNKKANEPPLKPLNFDFLDVPDKVTWTGTNGSEEAWWPFIGDYKIQEYVSQDWERAFSLVTAKNDGKNML